MRWSFATIVLVPRGQSFAPPTAEERRRTFTWARDAGFSGVELADEWFDFSRASDQSLQEIRGEIAEAGLTISGLNVPRCLFTRGLGASREYARLESSLAAAAALRTELVNFSLSLPVDAAAPRRRSPMRGRGASVAEHEQAAELVTRLADQAATENLKLALELHDDGLLDTPEFCLQLLQRVGTTSVGINPDVANLCRGPAALPDWRRAFDLLAPHAVNWHVKNYRNHQPAPLDTGDIDYTEAWSSMQRAGYAGWVSIESRFGDVWQGQKTGLAFLKSLSAASPSAPLSR